MLRRQAHDAVARPSLGKRDACDEHGQADSIKVKLLAVSGISKHFTSSLLQEFTKHVSHYPR
jgi:hypothetical protein